MIATDYFELYFQNLRFLQLSPGNFSFSCQNCLQKLLQTNSKVNISPIKKQEEKKEEFKLKKNVEFR